MARKGQENYRYKEIEDTLSSQTKLFNNDFLNLYSLSAGYKSALGYLFHLTGIKNVKSFTRQEFDFINELILEEKTKSSKGSYIKAYFEYLYANDLLDNEVGFEDFDSKLKLRERIDNQRKRPNSKIQKKKNEGKRNVLNIEEVDALEKLLDFKTERNSTIRSLIVWYLLFETDLSIEYIRKISQERYYEEGLLSENDERIKLPEQFLDFWSSYINRKRNGFRDLDDCVRNLGKAVGIESLTPMKIKATREANIIRCGNCGNAFKNTLNNWVSANGRLICCACAERIKKNSRIIIENISDQEILTNDEDNVPACFYSFEELRTKFLKTDYIKKHKRQIEIGDLGEAYVLDREYEKLKDTEYFYMIEDKSDDESCGYDILSFETDGTELFIEVKTSESTKKPFFMTEHERKVAEKMLCKGKKYVVYRIENILADNKEDILLSVIYNIFDNTKFSFEPYQWKINTGRR